MTSRRRIGELYTTHGARVAVILTARLRLPAEVAQDAVHDVFTLLLRLPRTGSKVLSLSDDDAFRYLLKSAYRSALRAIQRLPPQLEELPELLMDDDREQSERSAHELQEVIQQEVSRLPQPYRAVLDGLLVRHESEKEIAQRLGRTVNTVYQQLHRGLKLLRPSLEAALKR